MTMNMKQWVADILASDKKKSLPVLSFPSIQKMGITVSELINSSDKQAEGMKIIADSCPTLLRQKLSVPPSVYLMMRFQPLSVPSFPQKKRQRLSKFRKSAQVVPRFILMLSKKHANSSQIVRFWQVLSDHSPWQADFWTYPKH